MPYRGQAIFVTPGSYPQPEPRSSSDSEVLLQPDAQYALLELFRDGGPMMYFLVLASLLALGVIIAKAYILLVAHRDSQNLLEEMEELAETGGVEAAIAKAEETPGPVAAILLTGLKRLREKGQTGKAVEQAINTVGAIELGFLERGLTVLATVANVAPMMGFLGTVAGMISAFGAVAEAGQIEASLVAAGIKVALITTATGLAIAIPVNIAYNFFVTRIDMLIVDMEKGAYQVLEMLWRQQPRAAPAAASGGPTGTGTETPPSPRGPRREGGRPAE